MFLETLKNLLTGIDGLVAEGANFHSALIPTGKTFLSLAIIITLINEVYQFWIRGDAQELVSRMFRLFVIASIPFTLLMVPGNWGTINETIVSFFREGVVGAIADVSGRVPSETIKETLEKIVNAVNVSPPTREVGWIETIIQFGTFLSQFALKMLVYLGIALMAAAMLVAAYVPLVALQVGIIIGPLLVAWLPFEPMSDLARNWLKFMITNAMTFVVSVTLLAMTAGVIEKTTATVSDMFQDNAFVGGVGHVAAVLIIATIMLFIAYVLFQADEIAGGLIGTLAVGGGYMGRAIARGMGGAIAGGGKVLAGRSGGPPGGGGGGVQPGAGLGEKVAGGIRKSGEVASTMGRGAQAGGTALMLGNTIGGSSLISTGNALRATGRGLDKTSTVLGKSITMKGLVDGKKKADSVDTEKGESKGKNKNK